MRESDEKALALLVWIQLNPNLPDPSNVVAVGTMRYSLFDINIIDIKAPKKRSLSLDPARIAFKIKICA